ncbi:MAG: hexapeptide transferase [Cyclobacteriaceae bacterium]|nr:hexapeptide transferase [Cyclobacteriaceae bacterium]
MKYLKTTTGRGRTITWLLIIYNSLRYNVSILEYFQFRFFEKTPDQKRLWAGTGYMYEYQLVMNPKSERGILDDKRYFAKEYKSFFIHQIEDLESLNADPSRVKLLLNNPSGKIVFKAADGKCGKEVEIRKTSEFTQKSLIEYLVDTDYDLVEEFIIQHKELQKLSPSAVNTIRIFTQLDKDKVEVLGCRLRISVDSLVDNLAAGNLAAPIDQKTGMVSANGVYSDITKQSEKKHPITKVSIVGFQIPFWSEVLTMVNRAALLHPQNRSIGWDVAITDCGPGLIEGNHDWCKLLWQLPANQGLKPLLEKYI